jgi:protein-tyrosine-phosphatase
VRVLSLRTHNSARNQMAESWLRRLGGASYHVESAGNGGGAAGDLRQQSFDDDAVAPEAVELRVAAVDADDAEAAALV